jgi:cephalosporin hydroxylase
MSDQSVGELLRQLAREREMRREAQEQLRAVIDSAAVRPAALLNRLTGRGPAIDALRRSLDRGDAAPTTISNPAARQEVIDEFHRLYYGDRDRTWKNTFWMGTQVLKLPFDLWLYQEMIHRVRPDVIVECGTRFGGSALYMAHMQDLIGHGRVITVDIDVQPNRPEHDRITYLTGSSIDEAIVEPIRRAAEGRVCMVVLDSDHSEAHVYAEMNAYASIVSVGSYLVVEDSNVHGHPVYPHHPPGPWEAIQRFLGERDDFAHDPTSHKFMVTFNPGGVLQRLR